MVAKSLAVWLMVLVIVPFTAPFSSCDFADFAVGPGTSNYEAARFTAQPDASGDVATVSPDAPDPSRRLTMCASAVIGLCDVPVDLRQRGPSLAPAAMVLDIPPRSTILRL
jgi:hypothetical protein